MTHTRIATAVAGVSILAASLLTGCATQSAATTPPPSDSTAESTVPAGNVAGQQASVRTFSLPDLRGHTMAEVDDWVWRNHLRAHVVYDTEVRYNYSASCRVQKQGTVLRQSPLPGAVVRDVLSSAILLSIDC